ncbi:hypothetical protein DFJ73DRAFT_156462 [Zopfochytrium polystomum]|nr:hypothetical protein DFJ73DRAFT_156462 [Zopfochytrium polystomum]
MRLDVDPRRLKICFDLIDRKGRGKAQKGGNVSDEPSHPSLLPPAKAGRGAVFNRNPLIQRQQSRKHEGVNYKRVDRTSRSGWRLRLIIHIDRCASFRKRKAETNYKDDPVWRKTSKAISNDNGKYRGNMSYLKTGVEKECKVWGDKPLELVDGVQERGVPTIYTFRRFDCLFSFILFSFYLSIELVTTFSGPNFGAGRNCNCNRSETTAQARRLCHCK